MAMRHGTFATELLKECMDASLYGFVVGHRPSAQSVEGLVRRWRLHTYLPVGLEPGTVYVLPRHGRRFGSLVESLDQLFVGRLALREPASRDLQFSYDVGVLAEGLRLKLHSLKQP